MFEALSLVWSTRVLLLWRFSVCLAVEYSSCFISVLNLDLFVCSLDALMGRNPSYGSDNLMYVYELQQTLWRGLLEHEPVQATTRIRIRIVYW